MDGSIPCHSSKCLLTNVKSRPQRMSHTTAVDERANRAGTIPSTDKLFNGPQDNTAPSHQL
jgi:hypothetical protein